MEKVVARFQRDADTGRDLRIFLFGGGSREQAILDGWANRYKRRHQPCRQTIWLQGRACTSESPRRDAEHGLRQHAHERYRRHSYSEHLGATHPYCGFKGWRQNDSDMLQVPLPCRPCSVFGDKRGGGGARAIIEEHVISTSKVTAARAITGTASQRPICRTTVLRHISVDAATNATAATLAPD